MSKYAYDKLLSSKPIDQQARIVASGGSEIPDLPAFTEISPEELNGRARTMRKETNIPLCKCREAIVRQHGFESYRHYRKFMESRQEWRSGKEIREKNTMKKKAKRFAEKLSAQLDAKKEGGK